MPRAKRLCAHCGRISAEALCPNCKAARERERGSSAARGYGAEHQSIRRRLYREMEQAARLGQPLLCPRCLDPMFPDQLLEAGHTVPLAVDAQSKADTLEHRWCNPRGQDPRNRGLA